MTGNANHSFAILAYGDSPYLEECILSLKKQTVKSDIFISASGNSPFLENISQKHGLPLLINNKGGTIADDWSFAYAKCRTRYATLAHQDDIYLPEYTERCLGLAGTAKARDLITFTDYGELLDGKVRPLNINMVIKKLLLSPFLLRRPIRSAFLRRGIISFGNPICCPSVMFNKENIGDLHFPKEWVYNLDWDAWVKLCLLDGYFIYVPKKLLLHRIHKYSQTSATIENNVRRAEDRLFFRKLWPAPIAWLLSALYIFNDRTNRIDDR